MPAILAKQQVPPQSVRVGHSGMVFLQTATGVLLSFIMTARGSLIAFTPFPIVVTTGASRATSGPCALFNYLSICVRTAFGGVNKGKIFLADIA
jgi:hypothetical protein